MVIYEERKDRKNHMKQIHPVLCEGNLFQVHFFSFYIIYFYIYLFLVFHF